MCVCMCECMCVYVCVCMCVCMCDVYTSVSYRHCKHSSNHSKEATASLCPTYLRRCVVFCVANGDQSNVSL